LRCGGSDDYQEETFMRIALITARNPLASAADMSGQPAFLARALARQGHRVTIYARQDGTASAGVMGRGVGFEQVPAGPARQLSAEQVARHMPALSAHCVARWQSEVPDVVHAFGWASGLAALGAARETEVPVVQTFGSLAAAERKAGFAVSASRLRLETLIGRKAAAVLACSSEEAAELAQLGVRRSAIRVIPCGVDTEQFSPLGDEAGRGPRVRLVALTPAAPRGLETVIRALAQVPEAELVIVGGPDSRHLPRTGPFRELARLAGELRMRSRVKFAGTMRPAALAALLRSAHLLVSASAYEPTGLPAIQAMACGTPVVAAAVGGQRDAVIDGTTGLLITREHLGTLAPRLRRLLATPALLAAYGIAAADRAASRYSWERIASETTSAYERCLPGHAVEELAEAEEFAELEAMAMSS
jgi:glycosyltransferase involved in cell wall biosynthesis